jgi:UDP-N-acetyl-D-galactosamine dehydrogenase
VVITINNIKLAVIGLGYVGLPLAVEFAKKRSVDVSDINQKRINELRVRSDHTMEVSGDELPMVDTLSNTTDAEDLESRGVGMVNISTPVDIHKQPDFTLLNKASEMLGFVIRKGALVRALGMSFDNYSKYPMGKIC